MNKYINKEDLDKEILTIGLGNNNLKEYGDGFEDAVNEVNQAINKLPIHDVMPLAEIEAYKDMAVARETVLWKNHAQAYKLWALKNGLKVNTMEAGMTEPNQPHYERANND